MLYNCNKYHILLLYMVRYQLLYNSVLTIILLINEITYHLHIKRF